MINYLRDEFINNKENQPNTRNMIKDMGKLWGEKIDSKALFDYSLAILVNKQVELVVCLKVGEKVVIND